MAGPPAICDACGWTGRAEIFAGDVFGATFSGSNTVRCPRCHGLARILPGTYDFVGDAVRLVRAADWSISDLQKLVAAATAATETGKSAAELAAEHPDLSPIVEAIANRNWSSAETVMVLLTILQTILTAIALGGALKPPATEPAQATPTTLQLSDADVDRLADDVVRSIERENAPTPRVDMPSKPAAKRTEKRRPPKTHHKGKKRRR